jgi:5-methylcytosine-specific restriction endonuclease McrA
MSKLLSCLRAPIPEIFEAAEQLDQAVTAHLDGKKDLAAKLIRGANMLAIREWVESLWGKGGPWCQPRLLESDLPSIPKDRRTNRMPNRAGLMRLVARDGYHCRFCGIPVVRAEVRSAMHRAYPEVLPWAPGNVNQHAGFQALWLTYDHIIPHARGGTSDLHNMIVTCQPCNCGRGERTLEEVGLADPRAREPVRSNWDGLERFC